MLIRNYQPGEDWVPGAIIKRQGPHSYMVKVANLSYLASVSENVFSNLC